MFFWSPSFFGFCFFAAGAFAFLLFGFFFVILVVVVIVVADFFVYGVAGGDFVAFDDVEFFVDELVYHFVVLGSVFCPAGPFVFDCWFNEGHYLVDGGEDVELFVEVGVFEEIFDLFAE